MLRAIQIFILLFLFPQLINASAVNVVKGIVFLDGNNNSLRDEGEKGIEGICVSNGREVVQTNVNGEWVLPAGDEATVFVIKPANYAVPVNDEKIPQHFILYNKSKSAPDANRSVDFPLVRATEPKKFSALFFGDPQARGLKEVNYINHDVVEELIGTDALFGVSLGDITADGPGLFHEINQGIAQIGIPWYNTFGNHDFDRDAKTNEEKDATYKSIYGPSTYAFEYGQVVFIDFNNIYFKPDGKYISHFTDDQLTFVKNYLALVPAGKLVVLMMHSPIVACDNRDKIFELISDRKYTFSISGHVHEQMNLFVAKEMGWKGETPHHHLINATVCGSWWCGMIDEQGIPHATMNDGAPNGYSVITFEGTDYSVRFKAARRPDNYQMNIYLPEEIKIETADATKVLVNVFASSERSVVEMKVGETGSWRKLDQVITSDPACMRMHQLSPYLQQTVNGQLLEDVFGYAMDKPGKSRHIWQGNLPANLEPGTHKVTVRTTDMYNQTWTAFRIFRVSQ